jgi:hypothetical protein
MSLHDLLLRFGQELMERPSGPLAFRFILQPVMASFLAIRDGWHDAEMHRPPYFWAIWHDPVSRGARLREGLSAVLRVLLLGVGMDLVYQVVRLHALRPLETVVIALGLAFVPYLLARGPAARVGREIIERREQESLRTGMRPPTPANPFGRRGR